MTPRERLADTRLYLVCDARPRAFLDAALRGGADLIQLRDKTLSDDELVAAAKTFRAAADAHGALFILNDRPDLVEACDADGVHVGQDDGTPAQAATRSGRSLRMNSAPAASAAARNSRAAAISPSSSSVLSRSWTMSTPPRMAAARNSRGRASHTRYRRAPAIRSRGVIRLSVWHRSATTMGGPQREPAIGLRGRHRAADRRT